MQPGADPAAGPDGIAASNEDEKSGLKGVVGVVGVLEDAAADAQDHRAVPTHQLGEGGVVAAQQEKVEEIPVGEAGGAALGRRGADSLNDPVQSHRRHAVGPRASSSPLYWSEGGELIHLFPGWGSARRALSEPRRGGGK